MQLKFFTKEEDLIQSFYIDSLSKLNEEYIIEDSSPIDLKGIKILDRIDYSVYYLIPCSKGNDFYLKYFNKSYFYDKSDYNFQIGGLLSKTFLRNCEDDKLLKTLKKVYQTGESVEGSSQISNDKGIIIRFSDVSVLKYQEGILVLFENKTERRKLRLNILRNETKGVAIYQDNKYVKVNDKYAEIVKKSKDELIGHPIDLRGLNNETRKFILDNIDEGLKQKKYKVTYPLRFKSGKVTYYAYGEGSSTIYKNRPAVLLTIQNSTKKEFESGINNKNNDDSSLLNNIEEINKTFISYGPTLEDAVFTDNLYKIIEDYNEEYTLKYIIENFIFKEDQDYLKKMIGSLNVDNPEINFTIRIRTAKNNIKYIVTYIIARYDDEGNLISYLSTHQDITDELMYINHLNDRLNEKNKEIKDKEILIKEVHHRVKNNLQIILSLMNINEKLNKNEPAKIIEDAKSYIKTISLMHEKIYESTTSNNVILKDYLNTIAESTLKMYSSDIKYNSSIANIKLNINQAIPLGLIISELINNTIKYAFPEDKEDKNIYLSIDKIDKHINLEYKDNGIGLPDDLDFKHPTSLGFIVLNNLSNQINGDLDCYNDGGTCITIKFIEDE